MNLPGAFAVLMVFVVAATALYGPIAACLVELFPTRIRYTAMSLPYHIGTGWIGGFVPFTAFAEMEAAGRTDPAIHALLAPAQAEFDRAQAGDHFLKILHAGAGPRFQASRDLARFMLEGLARSTLTYDKDGRKDRLLMLIKRATHMLNRKGDIQDLWPE